jgi:hypothetical protein
MLYRGWMQGRSVASGPIAVDALATADAMLVDASTSRVADAESRDDGRAASWLPTTAPSSGPRALAGWRRPGAWGALRRVG